MGCYYGFFNQQTTPQTKPDFWAVLVRWDCVGGYLLLASPKNGGNMRQTSRYLPQTPMLWNCFWNVIAGNLSCGAQFFRKISILFLGLKAPKHWIHSKTFLGTSSSFLFDKANLFLPLFTVLEGVYPQFLLNSQRKPPRSGSHPMPVLRPSSPATPPGPSSKPRFW